MKQIKISEGQYLKDIFPEIISNFIYYKTLPGVGATSLEIECLRNSLMIEPNVPVIIGKCKQYKNLLGVYEGITIDIIIEYLLSSATPKKIMVTPESMFKIKEAASVTGFNLYKDFFLFFDECDRTIKDAGFRKKISMSMDDFFEFDKKAFISATPLEPSDPRFKGQDFKSLKVEPDYDYRKDIDLLVTNNVFLSLQKILNSNPGGNYCIFLNSTGLIASYAKKLGLKKRCRIFCSREAKYRFEIHDFKASDTLKKFEQINFFTSRFYSAVDIYMDTKPIVIMLTDAINVEHTIIDPITDAVQIVGRFRGGVEKIIHITNIDPELESMNKEEVLAYLNGCEKSYNDIRALRNSASEQGSIDTLTEALNLVPYSNYINDDESKNYYMVDNTIHEERVKGYYKSGENLIQAYRKSGHFNPSVANDEFSLTDIENLRLNSNSSFKVIVEVVVNTLEETLKQSPQFSLDNNQTVLAELNKSFPLIVNAYKEIGKDDLLKNSYSKSQLVKFIKNKRRQESKTHFGFLKTIQEEFPDGITLASSEIKSRLDAAIKQHGVSLRADIKVLGDYFKLSPRKTIKRAKDGKETKGYTIVKSKFNI